MRVEPLRFSVLACAVLAWTLCASQAFADDNDPPSRVARLALIEGSVSFQPAGTQDWVAAPVNRPLTTGDRLWSDRDGRIELQLDDSVIRLSSNTALAFLNLSDNVTQLQLSGGTLLLNVRNLGDSETYEVDTPNLAFSVLRSGVYRIDVDSSGNTTIGVRSGQGEVTGAGFAYAVHAGENDLFAGTDPLTETAQAEGGPDAFETWSADRDNHWRQLAAERYVSPGVVGYEDLDDYGSWQQTPDYGYVWFPRAVPVGWAPYHIGHWAYIPPWGYTWIDDQPWGFAPFHYGRWCNLHGAWGWIPAPPHPPVAVYARPVYAPALVAWVGAGAAIAWFALGPREVFVPSYPASRAYFDHVNVSNTTVNTTVINNIYNTTIVNNRAINTNNIRYVNRTIPGAVAATSTQAFTSAQPVARNPVRIDPHALASAQVRPLAPAALPTRQAFLGAGRASSVKPPPTVQNRTVVARTTPPPRPPAFATRESAIKQNGGRPLSLSQARDLEPAQPANQVVRIAPEATPMARPGTPPATLHPPLRTDRPPSAAAAAGRPPAAASHPNELPPLSRPPSPNGANSALEREHLQEQQRLLVEQNAERERVQQAQDEQHRQLAQQQAEAARKAQMEEQHLRETQALQERQFQQAQQMQQRQAEARLQLQQQQQQRQQAQRHEPPAARPAPHANERRPQ